MTYIIIGGGYFDESYENQDELAIIFDECINYEDKPRRKIK